MLIGNQSRLTADDAELVLAAQENPVEFRRLYEKWLKPVYRYFYFRLGNVKDAEDLTSQVFIKVYEDLPRYRSRGCFSAWLFTIAHARVVDHYRKSSRQVSIEEMDLDAGSPDLLSQTVQSNDIQQLIGLLRQLPEDEQELLRLRFMAELNYREIGLVMNRKEDAVRKSISRLLDRIRFQLDVNHD